MAPDRTATVISLRSRRKRSGTGASTARAALQAGVGASQTSFLLVPGLNDSDAEHWQTRWQKKFDIPRVVQPDWRTPDIDRWADTLEAYVRRQRSPAVVVAHSFGCLTTAVAAERLRYNIRAALLVAPADPQKFDIAARVPIQCLPFPSFVVGSRNDPWMDFDWAQWWAARWGSRFVDLGNAGHINSQSGLGDWDQGWELAQSLAAVR